jgi:hypothetical protein
MKPKATDLWSKKVQLAGRSAFHLGQYLQDLPPSLPYSDAAAALKAACASVRFTPTQRCIDDAFLVAGFLHKRAMMDCRKMAEPGIGALFAGERAGSDMIALLCDVLQVTTVSEGSAQRKTRGSACASMSFFEAVTASIDALCLEVMQRVVIFTLMHADAPKVLVWSTLQAPGGALHPLSVITMAALMLYMTAVKHSICDVLTEPQEW